MIRDKRNDAITVYRDTVNIIQWRGVEKSTAKLFTVDRAWNAGHVSVFN